jgi:Di-haem oxidoreductase, putative peroxidase
MFLPIILLHPETRGHRALSSALALALASALTLATGTTARAEDPPGEQGALAGLRLTQDEVTSGELSLRAIQLHGLRLFSTPFTKLDGYGDGPLNPADTRSPGGRPTLQGNGTFLRVNGLDAQSCLDCHGVASFASIPPDFGIGGVGGATTNAIIKPTSIDVADGDLDGNAALAGRFSNPPFVFGAGGVELLAKEMTSDLQVLRQRAINFPNVPVALVTKGVSFGTIVADGGGTVDTSAVEGVDPDLVVRPFGRKGDNTTVREFDRNALQFHMGMQPVEVVGADVDADGDGVANEILPGELSALSIFVATMERPRQDRLKDDAVTGQALFGAIGCADCHIPALETRTTELTLSFPEVPTDPSAFVYFQVNLTRAPARFERNGLGGITVPLFADLKRHDMGPGLTETHAGATPQQNREFTTARLWGVADTAPYLHDGRATSLTDAILLHGGDAASARDAFDGLADDQKTALLAFLRTLRTPRHPARRLAKIAQRRF